MGVGALVTADQVSTHGDPLVVGGGATVQLGDPEQPMSAGYDSLTVQDGGTLEILGDMTLTVAGDITIAGRIFANPKGKPNAAPPGKSGEKGPDNQPSGLNAGTSGVLGDSGTNWTFGGVPDLELRSGGAVTISGSIEMLPEFSGGDGGQGGHGGGGGSGAPGQPGDGSPGGFAGQAGQGGLGGHAGLPGSTLRIQGDTVVITPSGKIILDNRGIGGKGAPGGNGGNGGRGGDGTGHGGFGGGGGPAGGGGDGGIGGNGGILYLAGRTVRIDGQLSLKGSKGGDGGLTGLPGTGADGGNAGTDSGLRGGRGGDAGNVNGSGPRGGRGGRGGSGGALYLRANEGLVFSSDPDVSGGEGGSGGAGRAAAVSKGGKGGSGNVPGGAGLDSGKLDGGTAGEPGSDGTLNIWTGFIPGPYWDISPPTACTTIFSDTNDPPAIYQGLRLCGGVCVSSFVNSGSEPRPLELSFSYRWVTPPGTLSFTLGGRLLHEIPAPATESGEFQSVNLRFDDPALNNFFQQLSICLSPEGPAQVEIANFVFRLGAASDPPPPSLSTSRTSSDAFSITWNGVQGYQYQVQSRSSVIQGGWTNVDNPLPGAGAPLSVSVPLSPGTGPHFYRVAVSRP